MVGEYCESTLNMAAGGGLQTNKPTSVVMCCLNGIKCDDNDNTAFAKLQMLNWNCT